MPTAFSGLLKLKERIGGLDAELVASLMDPTALEAAFRQTS